MTTKVVVKDNALIDACFNLSLVEQRIMLLAIVEAREIPDLTPETPVVVSTKSYIDEYKVAHQTAYSTIWEACKTLRRREFTYIDRFKGEQALTVSGWVGKVTYVRSKGIVVLYLSSDVISMISRLEEQFTRYHLAEVSGFKSKYSIRVYELVIKWLAIGATERYSIPDLRAKLGVEPDEYKTMSLLKTNVIDKAIKEINSKTDITISYNQFKTGREISEIQFTIKSKIIMQQVTTPKDFTFAMTGKQIAFFASKLTEDPEFGALYAKQGESQHDFQDRISFELRDPDQCKKYSNYLVKHGYTEVKRKRMKVT